VIDAESRKGANIDCRRGRAKVWRSFAALALVISVICFTPSAASIAEPPPSPPERDVIIEFVRVLPPGSAYEPDEVRFDQLDPAVQATLRSWVPGSETNVYEVLKKRTIHLGEPQLVHIGPGDELEFRRVGLYGESVECAYVANGVVTWWSDASPGERTAHEAPGCGLHRWNSDVYVVAWVREETPAPTR
jgi:hypothetical protein